jgi:hypothetical protein
MFKYPSLVGENHAKSIKEVLEDYNEFYLVEKLDGSNIQFRYDANGLSYYGRNTKSPQFKGMDDVLTPEFMIEVEQRLKELYDEIDDGLRPNNSFVSLFGEYFGRGINRRIDYKIEQRFIAFYGVFIGLIYNEGQENQQVVGRYNPYITNLEFTRGAKWEAVGILGQKSHFYSAPVAKNPITLENYEDYTALRDSILIKEEDSHTSEGYVLVPTRHFSYDSGASKPFPLIKLRFPEFLEGQLKEHMLENKELHPLRPEVEAMVKENRLINILSKLGLETIENKNFGEIIKAVCIDIKEDFDKQHPEEKETLDKQEYRELLNVSKLVPKLLKEYQAKG